MSQLAPGLMVQEYQIEQVLGVGAFGITYRAIDTHLGMPVALKEFFPRQLVRRGEDGTVVPSNPENAPAFDWMKSRFAGSAPARKSMISPPLFPRAQNVSFFASERL